MQLEAIIHDLLFSTDCLVIPQFGGLVAKQKSASLNSQLHLIYPPVKSFGFNPHIKESDGLLYSVLASLKNIRFEEAKSEVDSWVLETKKQLSQGLKLNWEGIGIFFQDHSGMLQFIPNNQANFLTDTIHFHKIALTPLEDKQVVQLEVKPDSKRTATSWVWKAAAAMALPILGVGIFAISQKIQQTDWKYASFKLFGTKSRIAEFNPNHSAPTLAWNDVLNEETPLVEERIELTETPTKEETAPNAATAGENLTEINFQYDIIVGAFSVQNNAVNYVNNLKSKGFNAYLAGYGKNGLMMVAASGANSQDQAIKNLDEVQSKLNSQAWINEN